MRGARLILSGVGPSWRNVGPPVISVMSGTVIGKVLRRIAGTVNMEDLLIPCVFTATDIARGELVELRRGPVWLAVRAILPKCSRQELNLCRSRDCLADLGKWFRWNRQSVCLQREMKTHPGDRGFSTNGVRFLAPRIQRSPFPMRMIPSYRHQMCRPLAAAQVDPSHPMTRHDWDSRCLPCRV